MKQRNWLDLSRKLVDRYDLDFTLSGMSQLLGQYALSFFGEGVLATTLFPNPFPITLSGVSFGGTVGAGIAYDNLGMFTSIPSGTPPFTISPADATNPRWDLLVIRYKQTGDTPVPKPSDPITLVSLNLHDDFQLVVVPGVASITPSYPAKGASDIILAGLRVPANATMGTQCLVDLAIRETGLPDIVKYPVFKQEKATGIVDGSNRVFTLSATPIDNGLNLYLDGLNNRYTGDFSITGNTVTFVDAPALGQEVYAWYVVLSESSVNPLAAQQEVPTGAVNSINDTFTLAGKPANKDATILFIDGRLANPSEWNLIQTPTVTQIKFLPGSVPVIGSTIYCFYFVNPATVGSSGGGGGGTGSGGAYVPYGSATGPLVVDGAAGLVSTVDQRQLLFVSSVGGEVPVTANPQISPGSFVGQEMLIRGGSNVDYIVLQDGNGLSLNGLCKLTLNQTLPLFWDGTVWAEITRRN